MTDDSPSPPTRLVLFPEGTAPARERSRRRFLFLWLLIAVMLIWPIHPWVASLAPTLVFGLPFSLVWFIFLLAVMFVAALRLFLADERTEESA